MKTIVIVGGGFSGTMTAVQLSQLAKEPLCVYLINAKNPFGKGTAYSTSFDGHLLNVRAAQMSAFPDEKNEFVNWLKQNKEYSHTDTNCLQNQFIPRKIYGRYVSEILDNEVTQRGIIKLIRDEVIDIKYENGKATVLLHSHPAITANKVVLALGNFLPAHPFPHNDAFISSRYYIHDPWRAQLGSLRDSYLPILLVGTGLSTVDVFLTLSDMNYHGKIYITSRNGLLPTRHSEYDDFNFDDDLLNYSQLKELFVVIKRNLKRAHSAGKGVDGALDKIRIHIQTLWQKLSIADKKQFMRHLRPYWSIVRHRIPAPIHKRLLSAINNGQAEIITGRISSTNAAEHFAEVKIELKNKHTETIRVSKVINCTGPQQDYTKIENQLVKNLIQNHYILPHELKLGIVATPDGNIIQPNGKPSEFLYTLGSSLTGVLWESIAVPELRIQAKTIALTILNQPV